MFATTGLPTDMRSNNNPNNNEAENNNNNVADNNNESNINSYDEGNHNEVGEDHFQGQCDDLADNPISSGGGNVS